MRSAASILIIVNTIASIHGTILAAIIAANCREPKKPGRLLAVLIFLISLSTLGSAYFASGLYERLPALILLFQPLSLLMGPLLLFYLQALTGEAPRIPYLRLLHFLPAVLMCLLLAFLLGFPQSRSQIISEFGRDDSALAHAFFLVYISQITVYLWVCWRILQRYGRRIRDSFSNIEKINLSWMRYLMIVFLGIFMLIIMFHLLPFTASILGEIPDSLFCFFIIAVFIFIIGYRGMRQPGLFSVQDGRESRDSDKTRKYEKTGLEEAEALRLSDLLLRIMEEKQPHLDPDLTLPQLAEIMDVPVHHLSQVLNERLEKNFYQFINGYRLNEAKRRLGGAKGKGDKLLKIALESGFNSLSTFNRVFKEMTGFSPSQFRTCSSQKK